MEPDRPIGAQLEHVVGRLHHDFPTLPIDALRSAVVDEAARFSSAQVQQYVPLLAERAVRDALGRVAA